MPRLTPQEHAEKAVEKQLKAIRERISLLVLQEANTLKYLNGLRQQRGARPVEAVGDDE